MPSNRQILDAIALAAKSTIPDHEFRALVVALVHPGRKPVARNPSPVRREQRLVPQKEPTKLGAQALPAPLRQAHPGGTTYYYKLFRVKLADGRVTTVSLDPVVVTKAVERLGGHKEVGTLVRKLALSYRKTDGVRSCSRFVSQGLFTAIASASATVGSPVRET